jgi:hypothetical protein
MEGFSPGPNQVGLNNGLTLPGTEGMRGAQQGCLEQSAQDKRDQPFQDGRRDCCGGGLGLRSGLSG